MRALQALKAHERTVLVLHHLLDLPVQQVARETGLSEGAVRTRLSRARRALAAHLRDAESPHPPTTHPRQKTTRKRKEVPTLG
ncbi:hypothetical protein GCM10023237_40340 [Streptomyces coeruleoprunus]|uniref:sigma factor-like helix-turn-helix DNA-binding protein n=1 Tax=Streptomyces coeruleoprunus TaxID=285563 RepID=UPI0033773800